MSSHHGSVRELREWLIVLVDSLVFQYCNLLRVRTSENKIQKNYKEKVSLLNIFFFTSFSPEFIVVCVRRFGSIPVLILSWNETWNVCEHIWKSVRIIFKSHVMFLQCTISVSKLGFWIAGDTIVCYDEHG